MITNILRVQKKLDFLYESKFFFVSLYAQSLHC